MDGDSEHWSSTLALELAPAALFNFAVAFAVTRVLGESLRAGAVAGTAVIAGMAAFLLAWSVLRRIGSQARRFAVPAFDPAAVEPEGPEEPGDEPYELVLTPSQMLATAEHPRETAGDELELDDILDRLGPDSRVVRLFQTPAIPTAGELQAKVDQHLCSGPPRPIRADATHALHEALATLRQSLR